MAKKKSKKSPTAKAASPETTIVRGLFVLAGSIVLLLSLLSFAFGKESTNLLGLIGSSFGWLFHALLGVSSYILCLHIGWLGIRLFFNKSLNHLFIKSFYVGVLIASVSILISLIETELPSFGNYIRGSLYTNLLRHKGQIHLGGAPFYYITYDLPYFNLHRMFNTVGVTLIFLSTLLASLLFLTKITPLMLFQGLCTILSNIKNGLKKVAATPIIERTADTMLKEAEEKAPSEEKPVEQDSDFMRYVKVRIPGFMTGSPEKNEKEPTHSQEFLAIQPEQNLKVRPSLSRKEPLEREPEVPPHLLVPVPPKTRAKEPDLEPLAKEPLKEHEVKEALVKKAKREAALASQKVFNGDFSNYKIPPTTHLTNPKKVDQTAIKSNLRRQAEVLEETLLSFGIEAKVGQINCGPTITSFEVHPAIGVKVQKIKTLEDDIALNMEAKSIRIIAPIPGKAAVGIEVPNSQPQEVAFKDMLQAYQQGSKKFHIPILLGKAVNGDFVMNDLTKMPHCIIAGATGSGKSVCINTIVMSILHNAKPDEIKLVMVDPKKVELTPYTNLPHMLAPVITEPRGACAALNWMVKEMENRYDILKTIGLRNIEAFNSRVINKEHEASLGREIPEKMYYIVGIIDELADLMMVAANDIETPIARIAQMARAVGIHLILATQRPSREVITGLIKANFPTRISFKVASRVNSQIVLDETGAESLLGNGDMLFLPPGASHLVRAQGAFIRDEDINASVKYICDQAPPNYMIQSFDDIGHLSEGGGDFASEAPSDSLFSEAKDIVLGTGNASTTFLQRKLKIGYARAASLMDELERQGIVGPAEGSKPRKILAGKQSANSNSADLFDGEDF